MDKLEYYSKCFDMIAESLKPKPLTSTDPDCRVLISFKGDEIIKYLQDFEELDINADVKGFSVSDVLGYERQASEGLADFLLQDQNIFEAWSKDDLIIMFRKIILN